LLRRVKRGMTRRLQLILRSGLKSFSIRLIHLVGSPICSPTRSLIKLRVLKPSGTNTVNQPEAATSTSPA
jgi:hypothetical protein